MRYDKNKLKVNEFKILKFSLLFIITILNEINHFLSLLTTISLSLPTTFLSLPPLRLQQTTDTTIIITTTAITAITIPTINPVLFELLLSSPLSSLPPELL